MFDPHEALVGLCVDYPVGSMTASEDTPPIQWQQRCADAQSTNRATTLRVRDLDLRPGSHEGVGGDGEEADDDDDDVIALSVEGRALLTAAAMDATQSSNTKGGGPGSLRRRSHVNQTGEQTSRSED